MSLRSDERDHNTGPFLVLALLRGHEPESQGGHVDTGVEGAELLLEELEGELGGDAGFNRLYQGFVEVGG